MRKIFFCFISIFMMGVPLHSSANINNHSAPQNVIFMIGDGMGIGQIELARQMEYGKEGRLFLESLPHVALVHTYSANNAVTDSAAGGTALAIGKKTNNEMIGISADGEKATSILALFKENGRKTGVISTNTVTDATPAAFTAKVMNRWKGQEEIARQQLNNEVDVLMGGGGIFFSPEKQNGHNLVKAAIQKGYTFVSNREELAKAKGNKLLGLFHPSYMSFKLDRELLKSKEPNLTEMTAKEIEFLTDKKSNFFLMVEGARIDHASHSSDLTSIWKEVIEFDKAVQYAVNWAKKDGKTLVVVLADHETMGLSETEPLQIEGLKKIKATPEYMVSQLVKKNDSFTYEPISIKKVLKKYAQMEISDREIMLYHKRIQPKEGIAYPHQLPAWELGSLIAKKHFAGIISANIRQNSSSGGHTGNMIPLFAYGVGANTFDGVLDNTEVPKKIAHLMGWEL
ncbi:alkaline phosphatase [Bacillus sp. Bva_UNVM-123]|uniref:alkaline phosphatase n=1 Tax=Bacillus sp. Bva_UNVM-123 TaxID=2829798 RepID=UPI00391FC762